MESFVLGHGVGMETQAATLFFPSNQQADLSLRNFLSDRLKTL